MEAQELLNALESNKLSIYEDVKLKFREQFNSSKDPWLVHGMVEYYIATHSLRAVEIIIGVPEPHFKYLFDKLVEHIRGPSKLAALTLLGHVVRKQPSWLFKIVQHQLLKDLLKLLKAETEFLPLMSALLVLIILLPMIPAYIGPYLTDIFEVFSRLAAWNTTNPSKVPNSHLIHLQVTLYALFHRLYGMYPCNFLAYLRSVYSTHENLPIFAHTIKPMLGTVRMHPLLVTASKDAETATARWKKMEHHDVIVECAKFALDCGERLFQDPIPHYYWPRTSFSIQGPLNKNQILPSKSGVVSYCSQLANLDGEEIWSPSIECNKTATSESRPTSIPHTPIAQGFVSNITFPLQEGTSPPEAAVEATPETTPIKDLRHLPRVTPTNSSVVRTFSSFSNERPRWGPGGSGSTPSHSEPSSPMKKESSPFLFPADSSAFHQPLRVNPFLKKMDRMIIDRSQANAETEDLQKQGFCKVSTNIVPPQSPLRVISHWEPPDSPLTVKTQEDHEVETTFLDPSHSSMMGRKECDSVLIDYEHHPGHAEQIDDLEDCASSPCSSGGLHMPNSRSLMDFARQVQRMRYYSQSNTYPPQLSSLGISSGASPQDGSGLSVFCKIRRVNSWPDIKKRPDSEPCLPEVDQCSRFLKSKDKLIEDCKRLSWKKKENKTCRKGTLMTSVGTQTEESVPPQTMPYEHLFLYAFPSESFPPPQSPSRVSDDSLALEQNLGLHGEEVALNRESRFSIKVLQNDFIDAVLQCHDSKRNKAIGLECNHDLKTCRENLVLLSLQLQFERHRREVHAERNRRLLGKSRNNRALEEHNSALQDHVSVLQKEVESSAKKLDSNRKENELQIGNLQKSVIYWQEQAATYQQKNEEQIARCKNLEHDLIQEREKTANINKELLSVKSLLFNTSNELQNALAAASAGKEMKKELEILQKEIMISGEIASDYRDSIQQLANIRHEASYAKLVPEGLKTQLASLKQVIDNQSGIMEALKSRVTELEAILMRKDVTINEQKELIETIKEQYHSQLQAVESKYDGLKAINVKQQEHIVDLYHRLDTSEALNKQRGLRSRNFSGDDAMACVPPSDTYLLNSSNTSNLFNLRTIFDSKEGLSETGPSDP